eukprot:6211497-Pleurochrysis_carterae.AAC.1
MHRCFSPYPTVGPFLPSIRLVHSLRLAVSRCTKPREDATEHVCLHAARQQSPTSDRCARCHLSRAGNIKHCFPAQTLRMHAYSSRLREQCRNVGPRTWARANETYTDGCTAIYRASMPFLVKRELVTQRKIIAKAWTGFNLGCRLELRIKWCIVESRIRF